MKPRNWMIHTVLIFTLALWACEENTTPGDTSTDTGTDDPLPDGVHFGSLSVISNPEGASVLLDTESKGLTPALIENLEPGQYQLTISMAGYQDYGEQVTIAADNVTNVEVTLDPVGPVWNLTGRWSRDGTPDICDVDHDPFDNEVRGFCGVPEPLILEGSTLTYGPDTLGKSVDGTVLDEDHVRLIFTVEGLGSQTFTYTRL